MRVLFTTNFPSPYRTSFFNELCSLVDLTVAYEREKALHRDKDWVSAEKRDFKEVFLDLKPVGTSRSKGGAIVEYLKRNKFDFIVFGGYASPSVMRAILYCRRKKLRYCIEFDGAFNKKDNFVNHAVKKALLKKADAFFITCEETRDYIKSFGIDGSKCVKYPFTSIRERDILASPPSAAEKAGLKKKLGIAEGTAILSVGRFIPVKGYDVLMEAMSAVLPGASLYIVGGEPDAQYIALRERFAPNRIHFVDFKKKDELFEWYRACELFVFATRGDVWGLVVNEAMACALPVVSTDRCNAALELLADGKCGALVPKDDPEKLAEAVNAMLSSDLSAYGEECLKKISGYTIEKMAKSHFEYFSSRV